MCSNCTMLLPFRKILSLMFTLVFSFPSTVNPYFGNKTDTQKWIYLYVLLISAYFKSYRAIAGMQLVLPYRQLEIWTNMWNNVFSNCSDGYYSIMVHERMRWVPQLLCFFLWRGCKFWITVQEREAKQNLRSVKETHWSLRDWGWYNLQGRLSERREFGKNAYSGHLFFFFPWLNVNLHIHMVNLPKPCKTNCKNAFELWCRRRLLRVRWTARRSNQSILKEISAEYSLEGLMLKLKL